jgi:hypothetical protein
MAADERRAAVGAYAVVRGDEPAVFLAEGADVMSRVLALHLVAQLPARSVSSPARLEEMRAALLEERWADAVVAWIEETGTPVDVYDERLKVWTEKELDAEQASMEIRMAPLFSD